MIRTTNLSKRYADTLALDRLSLQVPTGAVFGLLGPNGAGKTTFLRLVMGLAFPDSGLIDRGGLAPALIGYLPERAFYPPRVTLFDYLSTMGRLIGLKGNAVQHAVLHILERLGLAHVAGRRIGTCSRGMLQRLGLAQALIGDPPLLLLDEPALALDPAGQKFMRDQIITAHHAGKTVILSSHHLDEVSRICSHVAVLNHGRLVRSGPLETILCPRPRVTIVTDLMPAQVRYRLTAQFPGSTVSERQITLSDDAVAHKAQILRLLLDDAVDIHQLSVQHATLEEYYLEATGE